MQNRLNEKTSKSDNIFWGNMIPPIFLPSGRFNELANPGYKSGMPAPRHRAALIERPC
jgi:hypothetical protein